MEVVLLEVKVFGRKSEKKHACKVLDKTSAP